MNTDKRHFNAVADNLLWRGEDDWAVPRSLSNHIDAEVIKKDLCLLGDVRGKRVLMPGAGTAYEGVALAQRGARVTAMDIAEKYLHLAYVRASKNNVLNQMEFVVGDATNIPFPDNTFDIVFAHAILHHLPLEDFKVQLLRVLKKRGKFLFSEPFGENKVLEFIRNSVPYHGKHRTDDERPLRYSDIDLIVHNVGSPCVIEDQLFSMINRFFPLGVDFRILSHIDHYVLKVLPFLKRFCRIVYIGGNK